MPSIMNLGQIAPSAKRCIKTTRCPVVVNELRSSVRKHRAPNGALRPQLGKLLSDFGLSESTERQKVL